MTLTRRTCVPHIDVCILYMYAAPRDFQASGYLCHKREVIAPVPGPSSTVRLPPEESSSKALTGKRMPSSESTD